MTSTYTTNQGLEKPATGDRSGTWGTMTNTNMDMLDRAISGVGALTLTGTATTLTTSDGSASDGNYKVLVLGGSPSGTNTITLSPNDGDKLYFVVNASGQSVIFSQGTGANVTIANGAADIIYADGAGSGAAVASLLANDLVFGGTVTVGVDDTGYDVKFFGATSGKYWLWDESADGVVQQGTLTVGVDDTGYDVKLFGATSGKYWLWDESADGVVQQGTLTVGVDDTGYDVKFFGATSGAYMLWDESADDLVLAGAAGIDLAGDLDVDGTTNLDVVDIDGAVDMASTLAVAGAYTGGGLMTTGGNIVIPDDGNIGVASDTDAIHIGSEGGVGISVAAGDTVQFRVYNNETGHYVGWLRQDNASSTTSALYVQQDGTGSTIQGYGSGHCVTGQTTSAGHAAGYFLASDTSHSALLGYSTIGVYGTSIQSGGAITGVTLSISSTKNFRISHGLREGHDLVHSSIEGPQIDVVYRGTVELVNGQASIDIDSHYDMTQGTFEWLTKSDSVQTFTSNETGWDAVRSSFSGDTITIECQNSSSTDTISWMVIAERGDPDIMESSTTDNEGNLIIEPESELELELPPPPDFEPPPED